MMPDKLLIEKCIAEDIRAQKEFYQFFAKRMFGVCLRFARNLQDAEDILQESFIKIFSKLKDFRHEGSLEGWIRRTVINTSINYYKKENKRWKEEGIESLKMNETEDADITERISAEELVSLLQYLPDAFRMVFNLYVVEGYGHKEIGELLGIPENTSKSHLLRGRKLLQQKIYEMNKISSIEYAGQRSKI